MKDKLLFSLAIATGTTLYDVLKSGVNAFDPYKFGFVCVFTFCVLLLVPTRLLRKEGRREEGENKH